MNATYSPFKQVFVEIPPSPYCIYRDYSSSSSTPARLKENPPRPHMQPNRTVPVSSLKRKLSQCNETPGELEPAPKKTKEQSTHYPMRLDTSNTMATVQVYCHQCNKKRSTSDVVQCTFIHDDKNRRCVLKFCSQCLHNRYGENAEQYKSTGHVHGHSGATVRGFKCPRCRDICNCRKCRKTKGLEPLKTKELPYPPLRLPKVSSRAQETQRAPKVHSVPHVKVKWTSLPTTLSFLDAQDRFAMREFFLRFNPVLGNGLSKTNLEELSRIGTSTATDDAPLPWVSEACIKSILLCLLSLFAPEMENDAAKEMKAAVTSIRGGGVNLNRILAILLALREKLVSYKHSATFTIRDPLPPPATVAVHNTRSLRNAGAGTQETTQIYCSSQMMPIVLGMIEDALQTNAIRNELGEGTSESKDVTREYRQRLRSENERWEVRKKELGDTKQSAEAKIERKAHNAVKKDLEQALQIALSDNALRFEPLGYDKDGRSYWALSPGVYEREGALDILRDAKKQTGSRKSLPDRKALRDWSWFIAVWGKRPENSVYVSLFEDEDEDASESSIETEGWWAFWQPEDIFNLARYLESTYGPEQLKDDVAQASDSKASGIPLVQRLNTYGKLLEWRISKLEPANKD